MPVRRFSSDRSEPRNGSYDEAIPLFQQALTAEPYNVTAAYSLALALTRAGRADEGRQAMQRFDTLRSSAYGVTYAQTYLSQGQYAEALTSTGQRASPREHVDAGRQLQRGARRVPVLEPSASAAPGGIALVDIDNDGDLDIVDVESGSVRLFRKDERAFTDRTVASRLDRAHLDGASGVVAGDFDNDTRPDLLVFGASGYLLLHQGADGGFDDVTATAAAASARRPGLDGRVRGCRSRRRSRHCCRRSDRTDAAKQR